MLIHIDDIYKYLITYILLVGQDVIEISATKILCYQFVQINLILNV